MKNFKLIRIISSILFGSGVGICIGVASKSVITGILVGIGLALCFAVILISSNRNDK